MLVKSLQKTSIETLTWKREVQENEIFDCKYAVYKSLKTMYSKNFEFLPLYVISKSKQNIKWNLYEKDEVIELDIKEFNLYKSFYDKDFIFIDNAEMYTKYIWKIPTTELEKMKWKRGRGRKKIEKETKVIETETKTEAEAKTE